MMEDALQRLHAELQNSVPLIWQSEGVPSGIGHRAGTDQRHYDFDLTLSSISREQLATENAMMRLEARKRTSSSEFSEQRRSRQKLPSWMERQKIVESIAKNRVVVLTGETGCGKTTQVLSLCCVLSPDQLKMCSFVLRRLCYYDRLVLALCSHL